MNRLKELRQSKKKTQQEIADIVGVTKRTYIYWEQGERQIKLEKAKVLADYFGVTVGYLLGFSDEISDYDIELHNKVSEQIKKERYVLFLDFIQQVDLCLSDKQIDSFLNNLIATDEINHEYRYLKKDDTNAINSFSLIHNYLPTIDNSQHRDIYKLDVIDKQYSMIKKILED
ncbi:helix-turn-helix transcriptional regulator [Streptococcus thermophilus]|uniref:helix-turn-helix domain-containing protein n=1 Tax=Streptococcus thermophilus TaxID=1308 RepID=UPI003556746D